MNWILRGLSIVFICTQCLAAYGQKVEVIGKVEVAGKGQAIPYATVGLIDKKSKKVIGGTSTDENGSFRVFSKSDNFYVEISFIGFVTQTVNDIKIMNNEVNLGTITLKENSQDLGEVTVKAERSTTEFKLDKRVFNVGQDLKSSGASVMEVLDNVPSVNVNIEGEITLRGSSGVQILINGKPSVIASEQGNALGTITAEMVDKVEVITNPSAKYDAEGSSGIINIIIKKEERKGINGSFTINGGIPHNHSVGLSLNRRTEKFNLFSQLGVGYRELPRKNRNTNSDLVRNTTVFSNGTEYRNEFFYNFILGTDYHINDRNVVTLSGSYALEIEEQPSKTDFRFRDSTGTISSEWYREETTDALNPKFQYELQYKSDFKGHEDHMLLFSALGSFFGKDQSSEFNDIQITGTDDDRYQETETDFGEAKYTFKLDYTKPFAKYFTIETGAQYVLQDVRNDYSVSNYENGQLIVDSGLTNIFDYNQNVLGIYGTGAYEDKQFGIKLGLRMENTDLKTHLVTTNESNDRNFSNFFPTVHTSYKLTERFSIQAGYSRRIYRPRLWDLNPFFNIRNTFVIRTGNPDLLPEFTDSYELSSIYILNKSSFNLTFYQRITTDVIERVSTFEDNVTTFVPENIGTNKSSGVEFNAKYSPHKKFTVQGDFNFNYFDRKGELEGVSFDFTADRWSTRWTGKLKLPKQFEVELTGRYRSEYKTVQGNVADQLSSDFGLRKKFGTGRAVINFNVRDIFVSRIRVIETTQPDFYTYNRSYRGRFITLGFSYGFGKGEAMEFRGRRRH